MPFNNIDLIKNHNAQLDQVIHRCSTGHPQLCQKTLDKIVHKL